MDPRLLRLYSDELTHLRECGAEFAREFPKVAKRLTMDGVEVTDPYVERLLEGFAFLTARIQLKMNAEFPQLIQHLLEAVYPNFLAPVPSMMVAQFVPNINDPNLLRGVKLERGTAVHSTLARGQGTVCQFRTAHEVSLWPIEIVSAQYFSFAPDLPLKQLPPAAGMARGGLRIKLRALNGARFDHMAALGHLDLHISAPDNVAYRLHELALGACVGSWVKPFGGDGSPGLNWRGAASVLPVGYGEDEALLPNTLRGFSGYRLLQEYAAMPQRFLSFRVTDLAARLARVQGSETELVLLFSSGDASLEPLVDARSLALFCSPAINLFPRTLDRISVAVGATWEHHVVPDRTRPMDFEVHSLTHVEGHGLAGEGDQVFLPLYASVHAEPHSHTAYYTVRREPRLLSVKQKQQGPRSAYVGQEVYLALVDAQQAPYPMGLRQISVSAWVSNRDLPNLLPAAAAAASARGADADKPSATGWALEGASAPVGVRCLVGPTRPNHRQPEGNVGWALVNQLSLNYLSFAGENPEQAGAALRSLLALYGPTQDAAWRKQIEGVLSVQAVQVTRRLPMAGPLTFGTGVEVNLLLEDLAFEGSSPFLLGCLLERFFARYVAINTFSETALRTTARGEIMRWPTRCGDQPLT
jgi:type VI secretion system protein ImpG